MTWPKKVPILSAGDIHKGDYDGPNGSHCLTGWCDIVFGGASSCVYRDVRRLICVETGGHSAVDFNDSPMTRKRDIAAVWNRVMRKLGYTEPCER